MLSQGEGYREDAGENGSKQVKGMINSQLQKFTPHGQGLLPKGFSCFAAQCRFHKIGNNQVDVNIV